MFKRFGAFLAPIPVAVSLAACGGATTAIPTPPPTIIPTVASTLVATPTGGTSRAGAGTIFKDPQGRFTFTQPPGWTEMPATSTKTSVVELRSNKTRDVFQVDLNSDEPTTLKQFADELQGKNKQYYTKGYVVAPLNGNATTLGGEPAMIIDAIISLSTGGKLHLYQVVAKRPEGYYVLSVATDLPPFDPAAEIKPITDTWKWA